MNTTIERLKGKPDDFKICKDCGAFNWYENCECHNCGRSHFEDFTPIIEWKIDEFSRHVQDAGVQMASKFPVRV